MLFGLIPWFGGEDYPSQKTWNPEHRMKLGDSIVAFEANGCMAGSHDFRFMGSAHRFEYRKVYNGNPEHTEMGVIVHVLKQGNLDHRDKAFPTQWISLQDRSLQYIGSSLWQWIR